MDSNSLTPLVDEILSLKRELDYKEDTYNQLSSSVSGAAQIDLNSEGLLNGFFIASDEKEKLENEIKQKTQDLFDLLPLPIRRGIQELGKPFFIRNAEEHGIQFKYRLYIEDGAPYIGTALR